jgi:acyl carrier protein
MSEYDLSEIYREVRGLILESLDKPDATCSLSTSLIDELDAESLDYLDVAFRIERVFGVKIQRGRIEKELKARLPNMTVKPNTDVSEEFKAVLKELMPEVPPKKIDELTKVKEIARLFTVATFVRTAIQAILEAKPGARIKASRLEGYEPSQLGVPVADRAEHASV